MVERRHERSRGGWVNVDVGVIGSVLVSSAQSIHVETAGSASFWVEMGEDSIFDCFQCRVRQGVPFDH